MNHASIGDIIELSNGLKMRLVPDDERGYFTTINISNGEDVTTRYSSKQVENLIIGNSTWGYGTEKYEIINIISEYAEFQEAKSEVLSVIDYALKFLEGHSIYSSFMCENGTAWTYDGIREFLKEHIKE